MTFLQRHAYSIGGAIAAAAWPFFFRRRRISVDNVLKCGITSDVHDNITGLQSWLQAVQEDVDPPLEYMLYCGDM